MSPNECGCPHFEYYKPSWDTHSRICEALQRLLHKLIHRGQTQAELDQQNYEEVSAAEWDDGGEML